MPKGLIFGERDKDTKAIALAFITHQYKEVPYEALRDNYYEIPESVRAGSVIVGLPMSPKSNK